MSRDFEKRKLLAITNSCISSGCDFYKKESCTHSRDTVDFLGYNICPLKDMVMDRAKYYD